MIFTTITLNPCLDRREYLTSFTYGGTNRPYKTRVSAGGKGINVSKTLVDLIDRHNAYGTARVNTVTVAGGQNGEIFKSLLKRELFFGEAILGMTVIESQYETRTCTKLITPASVSEINEEGKIGEKELKALIDVLADLVAYGGEQTVFLSGSMPTVVGGEDFTPVETVNESFPHLVNNPVENLIIPKKQSFIL